MGKLDSRKLSPIPNMQPFPIEDGLKFPARVESTKWSSLFSLLSINVGIYFPYSFDAVETDGVMTPPIEVLQAGDDYCSVLFDWLFLKL